MTNRRDDVLAVLADADLGTVSGLVRLAGGNFGEVWRVETTSAGTVVVRFCPVRDGKSSLSREALVLDSLGCPPVPYPQILWADAGRNVLVLTDLAGATMCDVTDPAAVAVSAAQVAAGLHGCAPPAGLPEVSEPLGPQVNDWAGANPDAAVLHQTALSLEHTRAPDEQVLVHGDFWTGNLLWDRAEVTGVVDWERAGLGRRGQDVAKMRLDLAMLLGVEAADQFHQAYATFAGEEVPNATYWDARVALDGYPDPGRWWLPTYQRLGYTHLTPNLVRTRLTTYINQVAPHRP